MVELESTIKYVCFDIGGVLVQIRKEWPHLLKKHKIPHNQFTFRNLEDYPVFNQYQNGELSSEQYFTKLARDLRISTDKAMEIHRSIIKNECQNIDSIVKSLNSQGIITGCLSNTNEAHWDILLEYYSVNNTMIKMASHIYGTSKPEEAFYRSFETESGCRNPEEILFFDDNPSNVMAAKAFGWHAHHIPSGAVDMAASSVQYWLKQHGITCNIEPVSKYNT